MSELVLLVEALQRRRTRWASLSGNPRGSAASVLPWDPRGAPEPLADPPWLGSRRLVRCSHQNDAFVPLSSWYFSRIVNVLVKCQGSPFFLRRGGDAHVRQSRGAVEADPLDGVAAVGLDPDHRLAGDPRRVGHLARGGPRRPVAAGVRTRRGPPLARRGPESIARARGSPLLVRNCLDLLSGAV